MKKLDTTNFAEILSLKFETNKVKTNRNLFYNILDIIILLGLMYFAIGFIINFS